jgi:hypothetical protein
LRRAAPNHAASGLELVHSACPRRAGIFPEKREFLGFLIIFSEGSLKTLAKNDQQNPRKIMFFLRPGVLFLGSLKNCDAKLLRMWHPRSDRKNRKYEASSRSQLHIRLRDELVILERKKAGTKPVVL